jgi:hypothetical protein
MRADRESEVIVMVILFGSTSNPMIVRQGPESCFGSL